ncbi:GNVR domain-containing protein [Roseovarius salis]|uniref:GumC family protein n=1 Tax=Roseovarius salis TaxID=3376063 RepID=UPI0037CB389A
MNRPNEDTWPHDSHLVPPQPPERRDGGGGPDIDLMYIFKLLRGNLRLIVLVTLLSMGAMFAYLQFVPPVYTARSQVILDTREERVTPATAVVSNLDVSNSVIAGEVVTIQSNVLIGEVVDQLGLLETPEFDPRVARPEPLLDRLKRIARGDDPPHVVASRLSESTLRSMVIDRVRNNLEVTQLGISYAIGIQFRNQNPELAAMVANAFADRYIAAQLESKLSATMRANEWLADRLDEMSAQVETADEAVVEFKSEMIDVAKGNEDSINQLLAELHTRLVASSTDRADAEVRLGQVESLLESGGLRAVADVVTSPLLEELQRRRAQLASNRAELVSTLGRKHPEMVSILAQIRDIDRSIDAELQRRVEAMRSEVTVTRNRESALQEQIEVVTDRADALSKASVRLDQLQRTAEATRVVYESFLSRYKETSAQADFQTSEARVIGRAAVPVVPSSPRKTLMLLAAMAFGLCAAIAFVFLRNMIRVPVSTEAELRALTNRPNLGLLPYVPHVGRGLHWLKREIAGETRSTFMERIKSIRTILFDASNGNTPRIVMVTSAVPNEGKTTLSVALANVLARNKSSVLLLDADLRHPELRELLNLPQEGGCLVDYFEGNGSIKNLTQRSESFGIDVVSPARACDKAADLLADARFANLLARLANRYRTIVVNAPPVLYLSDAVLMGKQADAVLFTVQCGRTSAKQVRNSVKRLETAGVKVKGTVLTKVRRVDTVAHEAEMYAYGY